MTNESFEIIQENKLGLAKYTDCSAKQLLWDGLPKHQIFMPRFN